LISEVSTGAQYDRYRPEVTAETTDENCSISGTLLGPLNDGHVNLTATIAVDAALLP
jgi:hypothetical protein